jgi:hypothetical protein
MLVSYWMGDQKKKLSRAPPCFGRHVKPLVPAAFAVVSTHQPALGYGPFSLYVIHKEGLCLSSGNINKLMMMMHTEIKLSFQIMPRAQNALAIVHAGFFFKVDSTSKITSARLAFSPITPSFVRATKTENILVGQDLFSDATMQRALAKLNEEIVPVDNLSEASPLCRKTIALGLFYKVSFSFVYFSAQARTSTLHL